MWTLNTMLCCSRSKYLVLHVEMLCLPVQLQCESKKIPPPYGFLTFFPKQMGIFNQFLHTYYAFLSTLDCKFLFNYLQL